jgi:protein-L-isoaspartate(D-aspartate) O-methyltransferase
VARERRPLGTRRRARLPWLPWLPSLAAGWVGTRDSMIAEIERDFADTGYRTGRTTLSPRVRAALCAVERPDFVPEPERGLAHLNQALPIGCGQTISQPFVVALMTELLELAPEHTVLELGTGSGYQAAILGRLARQVYSIEVVPELAVAARATLERAGGTNIAVRAGDGAEGWPEQAPFDAVIVTAATPELSPALIGQLKPGGRLVAPIGALHGEQMLTLLVKQADGGTTRTQLLPVRFVPLTHPRAPD